jgi:hypothetical protein
MEVTFANQGVDLPDKTCLGALKFLSQLLVSTFKGASTVFTRSSNLRESPGATVCCSATLNITSYPKRAGPSLFLGK